MEKNELIDSYKLPQDVENALDQLETTINNLTDRARQNEANYKKLKKLIEQSKNNEANLKASIEELKLNQTFYGTLFIGSVVIGLLSAIAISRPGLLF